MWIKLDGQAGQRGMDLFIDQAGREYWSNGELVAQMTGSVAGQSVYDILDRPTGDRLGTLDAQKTFGLLSAPGGPGPGGTTGGGPGGGGSAGSAGGGIPRAELLDQGSFWTSLNGDAVTPSLPARAINAIFDTNLCGIFQGCEGLGTVTPNRGALIPLVDPASPFELMDAGKTLTLKPEVIRLFPEANLYVIETPGQDPSQTRPNLRILTSLIRSRRARRERSSSNRRSA
jgi:hypothetical protein